jgi:hypothetical protein
LTFIEFFTVIPCLKLKYHAPPELELEIANWTLDTRTPGKSPAIDLGPKMKPNNKGVAIT